MRPGSADTLEPLGNLFLPALLRTRPDLLRVDLNYQLLQAPQIATPHSAAGVWRNG